MEFKSIEDIQRVELEIKEFFVKRCMDYDEAAGNAALRYEVLMKEYYTYEIDTDIRLDRPTRFNESTPVPIVVVYFEESINCGDSRYVYRLPLDILCDADFIPKMRERIIERRRKEAEEKAVYDAEYNLRQEATNMSVLRGILTRFPDAAAKEHLLFVA